MLLKLKRKTSGHNTSINLFWLVIFLYGIGLFAIFSATSPISSRVFGNEYHFAFRHLISVTIGIALLLIASKVNYVFWSKISKIIFTVTAILLLLVFVPGFGIKVLGASRWLNLGFTTIQPSEIAKLAVIFYFSTLSVKIKNITPYLFAMILVCGLIALEPDMGTTVALAAISVSMMFVSGLDFKRLVIILFIGFLIGTVMILSSGYRRDRLLTYLGQDNDTLGKSYHINQVLYALGSGSLFGVGIGQSKQKYLYLPETATDSIFPIFAEEFGFIGSMVLIVMIFLYIYKLIRISLNAPDKFSSVFTVGLASWVAIQAVFNLGSMVALLPLTGIPLPFISYGGTAIAVPGLASGIAINVESNSKNLQKR